MTKINTLIFSSIIAIIFSTNLRAQESTPITWRNLKETQILMKEQPKKIFIDVYTDWCGWCKKMDQTTFKDTAVATRMNKWFYAAKFNAEQKDSIQFANVWFKNPEPDKNRSTHELAAALLNNRLSYPSFVVLDSDYKLLTTIPGFQEAGVFKYMLEFLGSELYKTTTWEKFIAEKLEKPAK